MASKTEFQTIRADTRRLLEGQEGREVDFKERPEGVDPEDLVAFANASGGTILVGIEEVETETGLQRGHVIGCTISDQTKVGFLNKASSCRPAVEIAITVENLRSRPIYRIDIPEGSHKPYCTAKGTYKIRSDGRNVAIDPDMMAALILERETERFVERFQAAANEVVRNLEQMEQRLNRSLGKIEGVAERAVEAASQATQAAEEATGAAYEAAAVAEDAAWT
jgi:predicted HTH transcriptional regulator